jgi:hypothetical protein
MITGRPQASEGKKGDGMGEGDVMTIEDGPEGKQDEGRGSASSPPRLLRGRGEVMREGRRGRSRWGSLVGPMSM